MLSTFVDGDDHLMYRIGGILIRAFVTLSLQSHEKCTLSK